MKIALVGGTGDIGTGFALRWAPKHEIIIGSRKADKARESASQVMDILKTGNVWGTDNGQAIENGDVAVLCVPHEHLVSVTTGLKTSYSDQVVISPVVPMKYNGKFFEFVTLQEGSAAMQVKSLLQEGVRIVSAFHTICAAALQDRERELKADVLLSGDDRESVDLVAGLVQEIKSLRSLYAGPLPTSCMVECVTPMLLNVARRNKIRNAGIKIVSER